MDIAYFRPQALNETFDLLQSWGDRARLLAGGTDLLIGLRQEVEQPDAIIDISRLTELHCFEWQDGKVVLGALVTHRDVELGRADLAKTAPVLVESCRGVGSVQIRNRGTLGGSCGNASPAGDPITALFVLDAEIHLASAGQERWLPITQFFTGPGTSVRRADEMITHFRFSPMEEGEKSFFVKIGQRRAVFCSKVCAAATIGMVSGVVERCRMALGAVAPLVMRVPAAEDYLMGQKLTRETAAEAARLAAASTRAIDDLRSTAGYRRRVTEVLIRRGLEGIAEKR